jgi:tripartite-type tricarboxylate transporter receptor subunit TctC
VVTSGKLRALAVSSPRRSADYPDVPTVDEAGVPGYQSLAWYGLVGPKNLPADVLAKISTEVMKATKASAVKSVVVGQGGEVLGGTPQEFAAFIAAERQRYAGIVSEAGISIE